MIASLSREFLYSFISKHKFAVVSTVTQSQHPEAAVVGISVMPDLRVFFDTSNGSRKYQNLLSNPNVALVIGWDNEQTAQVEGMARVPIGKELEELLNVYFVTFPDGRERQNWPDIAYVVVDVKWAKYSDFSASLIQEATF